MTERRIIRLLHRVTRIEFDECANDLVAQEREALLICVLALLAALAGLLASCSNPAAPTATQAGGAVWFATAEYRIREPTARLFRHKTYPFTMTANVALPPW